VFYFLCCFVCFTGRDKSVAVSERPGNCYYLLNVIYA